MVSKNLNSLVAEFRILRRLGNKLAKVDSKISEILVGEVEEGVYDTE